MKLRSKENSTAMIPVIEWGPSPSSLDQTPPRIPIDFSPPLIAMVVVVATAFFVVTYFRLISRHLLPPIRRWRYQWRQWRHHRSYTPSSTGDIESPPSSYESATNAYHFISSSSYGLDEQLIKTIPLSIYTKQKQTSHVHDCAVCLLEFQQNDYVRTLPVCAHYFHIDCIDVWLRSHANCPLCRAGIFRPETSFIPLMAARIRPSLDGIILSRSPSAVAMTTMESTETSEIGPSVVVDEIQSIETDERFNNGRDFLFKRSYSFGFERSLAADRIVMEAATATPWRYRRGNFWNKRPSPFNSLAKPPRVFSFRYYRGMKSPFFRRRSGFFPLSSESNIRGSSRRTKSMITSPMFMRSSGVPAFSSSRLRCRDLEALLSPERLSRR